MGDREPWPDKPVIPDRLPLILTFQGAYLREVGAKMVNQNKSKQEDFFEGLTLQDIDNFIPGYDNALSASLLRYSNAPNKRLKRSQELLKKLTK